MAYVDRDSSRETALSGVIASVLVGGIGFGLVTGLAMTAVHDPEHHVILNQWSEPAPPPPPPPPEHRVLPRAHPETAASAPVPTPPLVPRVPTEPTIVLPHVDDTVVDVAPIGPVSQQSPAVDRSSRAIPRGDPSGWVTSDDYPLAALRARQQGITAFRLDIGADGRATGCTITASSGSDTLDQTACRMVMRRARFAAARDAGGEPIAATYSSRIEWRVPAD